MPKKSSRVVADHPNEKVRAEYVHQRYVMPTRRRWLGDDKKMARLIQYLRDPSPKVRQVAYAVLLEVRRSRAFRHRAEARAEAFAIIEDRGAPFDMRMAAISLLAFLGDEAAVPLIASIRADIDRLYEQHRQNDNFPSGLDYILNTAMKFPHPSYVPGLERLATINISWFDGPLPELIEMCRGAQGR